MTREAVAVDLSTLPEVARLAEDVARTRQPRLLQRGGEDIAIISPAGPRRRTAKGMTPAQRDAVLASVGGWEGLVDAERLKRELDEARGDDHPPVAL